MFNAIIVDDEIFEARCISKAIDWNSYNLNLARIFNNPNEVIPYLRNNYIDVVFSDIKMPQMDGLELCRQIKKEFPDIIIVLISAYADFEYARTAIGHGFLDYILKPVTYHQLDSVCRKIQETLASMYDSITDIDISFLRNQQILEDYLYNKSPVTTVQLDEFLSGGKFKKRLSSCLIGITNLEIEVFSEYIQYTWKHGVDRFYNCLFNELSAADVMSFPLTCSFGNISIISFYSEDSSADFKQRLLELYNNLKSFCHEILKVSITIKDSMFYNNLEEFKNTSGNNYKNPAYNVDKITLAVEFINKNYMKDLSVYDIADIVGLSPYYFCKQFKNDKGLNLTSYITQVRMEHAKKLLLETNLKIAEIYPLVGINKGNYFFKIFKTYTGLTPGEFRELNSTTEN